MSHYTESSSNIEWNRTEQFGSTIYWYHKKFTWNMQIFVILEYQPTLQPPSYQILYWHILIKLKYYEECVCTACTLSTLYGLFIWKESCLLHDFMLRLQLPLCLLLNWLNASQNYNLYDKLFIILGNNVSTLSVIFSTILYVLTRAIRTIEIVNKCKVNEFFTLWK